MSVLSVISAGDKIGLLTVNDIFKENNRWYCNCTCDCGLKKKIRRYLLSINRNTKSCGCLFQKHIKNQKTMEESGSWKGGRHINKEGYVYIYKPKHPKSKSNGYILEHRFIMEEIIGRELLSNENVHHINGDKSDNRVENLELWVRSQPCGQRVCDLLEWARTIIKIYE